MCSIDSSNRFAVGRNSNGYVAIRGMGGPTLSYVITEDEALNLAAWLLVMADPKRKMRVQFMELLKEIES